MSQEQLKTYKVIISFIDHSISRQQAAELLSLSTRQITRLKKGVLQSGAESLIHKNTGRKPSHAFAQEKKEEILAIHSLPEFEQVNFLHVFRETAVCFLIGLTTKELSASGASRAARCLYTLDAPGADNYNLSHQLRSDILSS